jgi:hypothetical protein
MTDVINTSLMCCLNLYIYLSLISTASSSSACIEFPSLSRSLAIMNKQGTDISTDLMNDICSLSYFLNRGKERSRKCSDVSDDFGYF